MRIDRLRFLAAASAATLSGAPAVLRAAPVILEAKCGSGNVAASHPIGIRMNEAWKAIEQESDSAIKVQFFTDDALGTPIAQVEQLRIGALQFMVAGGGALPQVKPVFSIDGLGFAWRDQRDVFRAYDGPLGNRIRQEFTTVGMVQVGKSMMNGAYQFIGSGKPIRTPEDLAGIKLRVTTAPVIIDLIATLGGSAVPIPGSQVYTALQTHLVDALGGTLDQLYAAHVYEVVKNLSLPSYGWSVYGLIANAEVWSKLPETARALITRNIDKYALLQRNDALASQTSLLTKFRQQGCIVTNVDQRPFRAKLGPYYAKYKGVFGADVWTLLEQTTGPLG
jgi:tripartite ATP-independent transporter DctP family solute receptor